MQRVPSLRSRALRRASLVITALCACSASAAQVPSEGPLCVATSPNSFPHLSQKEDGTWAGPIAHFWKLWAYRLGLEVELQMFESQGAAMQAVAASDCDFLAALPTTLTTNEDLEYTRPFARFHQALILRQHDWPPVLEELRALRYEPGHEPLLRTLPLDLDRVLQIEPQPLRTLFESDSTPVLAPLARRAVHQLNAEGLDDQFHVHPISSRLLVAATAADSAELPSLFDQGLDLIQVGDLRYLEEDGPELGIPPLFLEPRDRFRLDRDQLKWLREHSTIRLGASEWAPLTTVSESGQFSGIAIEQVRQIFQRLSVSVRFEGDSDWNAVLDAARSGEIDGLGYIARDPEKHPWLIFSQPVLRAPVVIVNRSDSPFLEGISGIDGKVAIPSEYGFSTLIEPLLPDSADVVSVPDTATSVRLLAAGKIDALVDYLPVAEHEIRGRSITHLKVAGRVQELSADFSIALDPEWPAAIRLVDQVLATVTIQDRETILQQFASSTVQRRTQFSLSRTRTVLYASLAILAVGAALLVQRRRQTRRLLAESAALLNAAKRVSNSGSFDLDPQRSVVRLSAESHRLFDLEPQRRVLDWEGFHRLYDLASAQRLQDAVAAADPEEPPQLLELTRAAEGTVHRCHLQAQENGRVVGTVTDITHLRAVQRRQAEYEEEAQELRRMDALGRLAGGIAHDFNNLLAVSLTNAELAQTELEEEHPARESVDEFLHASLRARDLVQQIQLVTRRDAASTHTIDLRDNLRSAQTLLRSSLPPRVELHVETPDEPLTILADNVQIDRVVLNLVVNATDARQGDSEHTILIRGERLRLTRSRRSTTGRLAPGDYARILVADTGTGIAEEALPRIFEPYFTSNGSGHGTGLGLAVVHAAVRDHGGGLFVRSGEQACCSGFVTEFEILLPLAETTEVGTAGSVELATGRTGTGSTNPTDDHHPLRVLLVDDQVAVLEATRKLLAGLCHCEVEAFSDPRRALERFRDLPESFDLVISDVLMPGLSGVELTREIFEHQHDATVVLMTGHEADEELNRCEARALLRKPVSVSAWQQLLAEVRADPSSRSTEPAAQPAPAQHQPPT